MNEFLIVPMVLRYEIYSKRLSGKPVGKTLLNIIAIRIKEP